MTGKMKRSGTTTMSKENTINDLRLEYLTIKNDMTQSDLSQTSLNILYNRIEDIRSELLKLGANAR